MLYTDIETMGKNAANKADICNNHLGKYMTRAIMAGFYIVVATILSNITGAVLLATFPQFGKLLSALLFSTAIILVVFFGAELFTGNNMTMAMGVYAKTVKPLDMIKVWCLSYVGNFVGAFILSAIFVYSNASHKIMVDYYESFIYNKLNATPVELVLRGVLCNFLVCLAVYAGQKVKSESARLTIMMLVIMTFVAAGFEHCIANMGTFSIAYMLLGDIGTMAVVKSMIFVTIGNILGGAVLLALPLKLMSDEH